jgi:hypothetical protein
MIFHSCGMIFQSNFVDSLHISPLENMSTRLIQVTVTSGHVGPNTPVGKIFLNVERIYYIQDYAAGERVNAKIQFVDGTFILVEETPEILQTAANA